VINGLKNYRQEGAMLQLEWPWSLLLLPLPLLVYRWMPSMSNDRQSALKVSFIDDFNFEQTLHRKRANTRLKLFLVIAAWMLLIFSAARPQWLGDSIQLPVSGRDLMIAMDLSESMRQGDFVINGQRANRLQVAKMVADEFIELRRGDRVGLILFGQQAYLQVPLTFDLETVRQLLSEAVINLAGQRTAIGDAIGLALKRLEKSPQKTRVLILMTDGANTAGRVQPFEAAEIAAKQGLKIYTIGIGRQSDRELDVASLTRIADITGGRFFRARNTEELEDIYALLDELEPVDSDEQTFRPVSALFFWPLSLALLLAVSISLVRFRE
jgi:Ca-activated chloride channel homolog